MRFHFRFLLVLIVWLQVISGLFAQTGDDCPSRVKLGIAPVCNSTVYHNIGADATQIGNDNEPTCFAPGPPQRDIWFEFVASDTITDYTLILQGTNTGPNATSIRNIQAALYRGDCEMDGLALFACTKGQAGSNLLEFNFTGLDFGETYFLRVSDYGAPGNLPTPGDFTLCLTKIKNKFVINNNSSNLCQGILYDSGGPTGDYTNNENKTFSICPPNGNNACVTLTVEQYLLHTGDSLVFYDGLTTASDRIAWLTYPENFFIVEDTTYGGVDFTVTANSGCMTVAFKSDAKNSSSGFIARWQCASGPCMAPPKIQAELDPDPQQIKDALTTSTARIDNVVLRCPKTASGLLADGALQALGFDKGIVLTSGNADYVTGPNSEEDKGQENEPFDLPPAQVDLGDPDLNFLSANGEKSFDACVLEMDVFVASEELAFDFVFGSEEYPEYAGAEFNDIFAFLVSGPGIVGDPGLNNQKNIATLPYGITPVEINSVNFVTNWQYYKDNTFGQSLQYDGLVVNYLGKPPYLTARTTTLPCNTYHLKLAIADRGDEVYDSGVFVANVRGGTPQIDFVSANGLDYLIEGCSGENEKIRFTLPTAIDKELRFQIKVSGSATSGADYLLNLPQEIVFNPGQTQISFPISILADALAEGEESIIITLSNNFGCGEVVYTTLTLLLREAVKVELFAGKDTLLVCPDAPLTMQVEGALNFFWQPVSLFDNPFAKNPTIQITTSQWVTVTGTLRTCEDKDSIFLQVAQPTLDLTTSGSNIICEGTSLPITANTNFPDALEWINTEGLKPKKGPLVVASPGVTTVYKARVTLNGCVAEDSIKVGVEGFSMPLLLSRDTQLCTNTQYFFGYIPDFDSVSFSWSPGIFLSDSTYSVPQALFTETGTWIYRLTAVSVNGLCTATDSVKITVVEGEVAIAPSIVRACKGDQITLEAETKGVGNFTWKVPNGASPVAITKTIVFTAEVPGFYYAVFDNGTCVQTDSVYINLDSLPSLNLIIDPSDVYYCPGESLKLTTTTYNTANYPGIQFQWIPPIPGIISVGNTKTLSIEAVSDHTYQLGLQRGQCRDTLSIDLDVLDTLKINALPTDTLVCPGSPVTLQVIQPLPGSYTWLPENLSGSSITINPTTNTVYTVQFNGKCALEADTIQVQVINQAGAMIVCTPDSFYTGDKINLSVNKTGFTNFFWYSSGVPIGTSNPQEFSLPFNFGKPLPIELQVTDSFGCTLVLEKNLTPLPERLEIPNAFTPDGDEYNATFGPVFFGKGKVLQMTIWNRWGQVVYQSNQPKATWNGTQNGDGQSPCPMDVYLYLLELQLSDDSFTTRKGQVLLIR